MTHLYNHLILGHLRRIAFKIILIEREVLIPEVPTIFN